LDQATKAFSQLMGRLFDLVEMRNPFALLYLALSAEWQ
jgi:hypothetical protein